MADSSLSPHWHRMHTYSHRLYPGLLLPPLMSVYKKRWRFRECKLKKDYQPLDISNKKKNDIILIKDMKYACGLHVEFEYLLICIFILVNFRYKAIVNPMDIQTSSAVLWTCLKATAIWVISMLLAIPEAVFSELAHINDTDNATFTACIPYPMTDDMHPKIHSVLLFLVYFLIPLVIISIYYYHIAKSLIKSAHNIPGEHSEHSKRQVSNLLFTSWQKICVLYTILNESRGIITSKLLDFAEY